MAYGSFSASRVTPRSKLRFGLSVDRSKETYEFEDETVPGRRRAGSQRALRQEPGRALVGRGLSQGRVLVLQQHRPLLGRRSGRRVQFFPLFPVDAPPAPALYTAVPGPGAVPGGDALRQAPGDLFKEELSLTLDLREKLGTISLSAEASNYFNDLAKYRVDTFAILNLRLYKGLTSTSSAATPITTIARSPCAAASRPTRRCSCAS